MSGAFSGGHQGRRAVGIADKRWRRVGDRAVEEGRKTAPDRVRPLYLVVLFL